MKTLKQLVTEVVNSYGSTSFSAHQVTLAVRKIVNESTDQFDLRIITVSGKHVYAVEHNEVKDEINSLFHSGVVGRVFNGTYFEYNNDGIATQPATKAKHSGNINNLSDVLVDYVKGKGSISIREIQRNLKTEESVQTIQEELAKSLDIQFSNISHRNTGGIIATYTGR